MIALLLSLSFGGFETGGNGGDVWHCKNHPDFEYRLFDYFDGENVWGLKPNFGEAVRHRAMVDLALRRLEVISPNRAIKYRRWWADMVHETREASGMMNRDIKDEGFVTRPREEHECKRVQVFIQVKPKPNEPRYLVDQTTFDALPEMDKAGLILHELIYREALEFNPKDSENVRFLTALIANGDFREYDSLHTRMQLFVSRGVPTLSFDGVDFNVKKYPFYMERGYTFGRLAAVGSYFSLHTDVHWEKCNEDPDPLTLLHEPYGGLNHLPRRFNCVNSATISLPNKTLDLYAPAVTNFAMVSLHPNGRPYEIDRLALRVGKPIKIKSKTYELLIGPVFISTQLHANGEVRKISVKKGSTVYYQGVKRRVRDSKNPHQYLHFDRDGNYIGCSMKGKNLDPGACLQW